MFSYHTIPMYDLGNIAIGLLIPLRQAAVS